MIYDREHLLSFGQNSLLMFGQLKKFKAKLLIVSNMWWHLCIISVSIYVYIKKLKCDMVVVTLVNILSSVYLLKSVNRIIKFMYIFHVPQ
jgi:hypothetical protein